MAVLNDPALTAIYNVSVGWSPDSYVSPLDFTLEYRLRRIDFDRRYSNSPIMCTTVRLLIIVDFNLHQATLQHMTHNIRLHHITLFNKSHRIAIHHKHHINRSMSHHFTSPRHITSHLIRSHCFVTLHHSYKIYKITLDHITLFTTSHRTAVSISRPMSHLIAFQCITPRHHITSPNIALLYCILFALH